MGTACTAHHSADWDTRHLAPQGALHFGILAQDFRTTQQARNELHTKRPPHLKMASKAAY